VGKFLRMKAVRAAAILLLAGFLSVVWAQDKPADAKPGPVQQLRTVRLMPLATPPSFDWQRIQNAYAFAAAHRKSIDESWKSSGLCSLFASKDIFPVLLSDAKYFNDYNTYAQRTIDGLDSLIATPKDKTQFVAKNYKAAVSVGLMHLDLSQAFKLKWNPQNRVPGSQQSFAYETYAFLWQPIQKMLATQELDSTKDARAIEDWLYLWHTLGYGMGLDQRLLPKDAKQTSELYRVLCVNQWFGPGEEMPRQIRALMRNEMGYLYSLADNGNPIDDPTKLDIRKQLAKEIGYTPGLSKALGLSDDPFQGLQQLDRTID